MSEHRPQRLFLGPLEAEIMEIIWQKQTVTAREIHEQILSDPNRELAYASVTTVLRRLVDKGWLTCDRGGRAFSWSARVSRTEAQALQAHSHLAEFLNASTPEVVAAFADRLDRASIDRLEAVARRIEQLRRSREQG